ncbi:MAG: hypothetical protein K9G62_04470 [Alphaproteobacteria bacterium]|nr:hypothetical protein [Alphaproteobacteria bacterium]
MAGPTPADIKKYKEYINDANMFDDSAFGWADELLPSGTLELDTSSETLDSDFHFANRSYVDFLIEKCADFADDNLEKSPGLTDFTDPGKRISTLDPDPVNDSKKAIQEAAADYEHTTYWTPERAQYINNFLLTLDNAVASGELTKGKVEDLKEELTLALSVNQGLTPLTLPTYTNPFAARTGPVTLDEFKQQFLAGLEAGYFPVDEIALSNPDSLYSSLKELNRLTQEVLKPGEESPIEGLDEKRYAILAATIYPETILERLKNKKGLSAELDRLSADLDARTASAKNNRPREETDLLNAKARASAAAAVEAALGAGAITQQQHDEYVTGLNISDAYLRSVQVNGEMDPHTIGIVEALVPEMLTVNTDAKLVFTPDYESRIKKHQIEVPGEATLLLFHLRQLYQTYDALSAADKAVVNDLVKKAPYPEINHGEPEDDSQERPEEMQQKDPEAKGVLPQEEQKAAEEAAAKAAEEERKKVAEKIKQLQTLRGEHPTGLYTDIEGPDILGKYVKEAYDSRLAANGPVLTDNSDGNDDPADDPAYFVGQDGKLFRYEKGKFIPLMQKDAKGQDVQAHRDHLAADEEEGDKVSPATVLAMGQQFKTAPVLTQFKDKRLQEMKDARSRAIESITGDPSKTDALITDLKKVPNLDHFQDILHRARKDQATPAPDDWMYLIVQIDALNRKIDAFEKMPDYSLLMTDSVSWKDYHERALAHDIAHYAATGKVGNAFDMIQTRDKVDFDQLDDRLFEPAVYDLLKRGKPIPADLIGETGIRELQGKESYTEAEISQIALKRMKDAAARRGLAKEGLSEDMQTGRFNPYFGDVKLAYEGYGRIPFDQISKDLLRYEIEVNLKRITESGLMEDFKKQGVVETKTLPDGKTYLAAVEGKISTDVVQKLWDAGILDDTDLYGENAAYHNRRWNAEFGGLRGDTTISAYKNGQPMEMSGKDMAWRQAVRWTLPESFEKNFDGIFKYDLNGLSYGEAEKTLQDAEKMDMQTVFKKYDVDSDGQIQKALTEYANTIDTKALELLKTHNPDSDAQVRTLLQDKDVRAVLKSLDREGFRKINSENEYSRGAVQDFLKDKNTPTAQNIKNLYAIDNRIEAILSRYDRDAVLQLLNDYTLDPALENIAQMYEAGDRINALMAVSSTGANYTRAEAEAILNQYDIDGQSTNLLTLLQSDALAEKILSGYEREDAKKYMALYPVDGEDRSIAEGRLKALDLFHDQTDRMLKSQSVVSYYKAIDDGRDYQEARTKRYLPGEQYRVAGERTSDEVEFDEKAKELAAKRAEFNGNKDGVTDPALSSNDNAAAPKRAPKPAGQ